MNWHEPWRSHFSSSLSKDKNSCLSISFSRSLTNPVIVYLMVFICIGISSVNTNPVSLVFFLTLLSIYPELATITGLWYGLDMKSDLMASQDSYPFITGIFKSITTRSNNLPERDCFTRSRAI